MKTYLLLLAVILVNGSLLGRKNKRRRKKKKCKHRQKLSEQRSIEFRAKNPENTIWPYEYSYVKATIKQSNVPCGEFKMRVVDIPLTRLINKNSEWQLMTNEDENGVGDIPIHLLSIKPSWKTRNIKYKTIIKAFLLLSCVKYEKKDDKEFKFRDIDVSDELLKYKRCLLENADRFHVGGQAKLKHLKWNLKWSSSIFSFKSKTYKIKINSDFIENMHPGINGAGAINKVSKVYTPAYKSFSWLTKYLEISLNMKHKTNNNNYIQLNYFPMLHYSQYDNTKCGSVCETEFKKIHFGQYPFNHEFLKFVSIESSERLGRVKMKFQSKFVHALGLTDAKIPNLIKKNKNIKLRLSLKRLCGAGGYCKRFRQVFGMDGWDLFHGEQIEFEFNILGNKNHFRIFTYQNPIITSLYASNVLVFGKGMRKKTMMIKPTKKVEYGARYQFEYKITTTGAWHKWYLYYQKIFESEKNDFLAENEMKKDVKVGKCIIPNMFEPKRPMYSYCDWGALKTKYRQQWYVEMPKPGYFKHGVVDIFRFSNLFNVGDTKCGLIEAILDEWPTNGKKYYIKLLLKYLGTEGGIIMKDNVLRYPEVREIISFRKHKKKWCITAKVPGTYVMTFEPYGSLLNLFPNAPSQMQINIQQKRTFKIRIDSQLNGVTVYNNEWSAHYKISINKFPDKDDGETEIVITPKSDHFQFSPSRFIWSVNTLMFSKKRKKQFKFRPLLDCAFGGVNVNIKWEITGMISRVRPYPIPMTLIRVNEHIPSDGCNDEQNADAMDESDEFIPTDIADNKMDEQLKNINNITNIKPKQMKLQSKNKSPITFIVALILLLCFGLIIIALCAFGCLGNDKEFELLVSTQLRKAIVNKQTQMLISNMNNAATDNVVQSHYAENVNARERLKNQNYLFTT